MNRNRLSTGSEPLDILLDGGLERGTIIQVYGEPGCGKSTLVLLPMVACLQEGKRVILFDSEGFSVERFRQIAGANAENLADKLFIYEPFDFEQQGVMIAESEKLLKKQSVDLYIMDSATAHYRTELGKTREAQRKLASQMMYLIGLAKRYHFPVLITNQVYIDPESGEFRPLGGPVLQHLSKTIIRIDKLDHTRKAILTKHRSIPEGSSFEFEITECGIQKKEPRIRPS